MKNSVVFSVAFISLLVSGLSADIKFPGVGGSLNFDQTDSSLILSANLTGFNGTLKIKSAAGAGDNVVSTGSETIAFSNGFVKIGNNFSALTGSYVPGLTTVDDTITLGNGDFLQIVEGETVPQAITVSASSTATIGGSTVLSGGVTLTDNTSVLNLGIEHKLDQDITLNSGKVVLTDDLGIADGVRLVGTGTIDINKKSLGIGSSSTAWTGTLTLNRAQDVQLNGRVVLDGTWNFATDGTDKESVLNGNGNILDMSGGGTLQVGADHTLFVSDVNIIGFGGAGGSFDLADSATPGVICFSNTTIQLSGNYVHGTGLMAVESDLVNLVSGGQYTFTVDANATTFTTELRVDGVALYYETLGGTNTSPFMTTNGGLINTINGGVIRSAVSDVQPVDTVIDADAEHLNTVSLTGPRDLRVIEKIVITNPASPTARVVTIDAGGDWWIFPEAISGGNEVITVAADTTLILKNVVLENFSLSLVDLTAANSAIQFSDGVIMMLSNTNATYSSASELRFVGRSTVIGGGVQTSNSGGIVIDGAGVVVTFDNVKLNLDNTGSGADTLACTTSTAAGEGKVIFKDCDVRLASDDGATSLLFDKGSMEIEGKTSMEGFVDDAVNGETTFDWTSTGTLIVKHAAILSLGHNLRFKYEPYIPPDDGDTSATKRHLRLEDAGSTLFCDGCVLESTATGLALDKGNFVINNEVVLTASAVAAEGAELGTSLNLEIMAASVIDIDGTVHYITTSL